MKKKLLLVLCMLMVALTGCGAGNGSAKNKEVNLNEFVIMDSYGEGVSYSLEAFVGYMIPFLDGVATAEEVNEIVQNFELECKQDTQAVSNGDILEYKWTIRDEDIEALEKLVTCDITYGDFNCAFYEDGNGVLQGMVTDASDDHDYAKDGKKGIDLNDYLETFLVGQDGYGKSYTRLDSYKLMHVCAEYLADDSDMGNMIDIIVNHTIDTYDENYDYVEFLSNGDVIYFDADVYLEDYLTVEVTPVEEKEYKVSGLDEFQPVDPFTHPQYVSAWVDENGSGLWNLTLGISYKGPDGTVFYHYWGEDELYKEGETYTFALTEEHIAEKEEMYGKNIFERTEAEITIENVMDYYAGERAEEIFQMQEEKYLKKVDKAVTYLMDSEAEYDPESSTIQVERVGMMFYYNDDTEYEWKEDYYGISGVLNSLDQMVYIYKITNEDVPEGWYSYMAPLFDMVIRNRVNPGTLENEEYMGGYPLDYQLTEDWEDYHTEYDYTNLPMNVDKYFTVNGETYYGHRDLEDVFAAIEKNMLYDRSYDHLVVTDSLKEYVSEY